jgi:VIT1/CCC1 family predicted Fe2+/Mn2+ transporter
LDLEKTHIEKHFTATETIRDIVIGMSDGLTVPFALAAGLSGVVASAKIVVTAGLAEIAAGSIAMGLGGYLAARTDLEHYRSEQARELEETQIFPEIETEEVAEIFRSYGLGEEHVSPVVEAIKADTGRWVDFMMRFELGLDAPDPARALRSALTIAFSYVLGGLIPLSPYILSSQIKTALFASVGITLLALFVFGFTKGKLTGVHPWKGAAQTALIGGLAASAAFLLARLIS